MLHNNLGSVTDITDSNANVTQHFTYTPFGEQKQTKGTVPFHPVTYKGFTGHEEIEGTKLIHMDGRIYDPVIGRFLSADPFVQDPANSQSLNRYSYCINNPLAFTDPTGFSCWRNIGRWIKHNPLVRIAIGVVVGVALGIVLGPVGFAIQYAWTIGSAAAGIVTGGLALASGVGWKQALGEGFVAASLVGSLGPALDRIFNKPPKSANPSGNPTPTQPESGDSGAEKPKTPGEDFTDKSSYNSAQNGTPPDGKFFQDTVPGYVSNRASASSNYSNGAGSEAYWGMHVGDSHVEIDMQRIASDGYSTLSAYAATGPGGKNVDGYMLEPSGPSTAMRDQNKRIPGGTYVMNPIVSPTLGEVYEISNKYVPGGPNGRHILLHSGNSYLNTHGCPMPGNAYGYGKFNQKTEVSYFIKSGTSKPAFDALKNLIGNNRATLTIRDVAE